jgi:hypothetical protein
MTRQKYVALSCSTIGKIGYSNQEPVDRNCCKLILSLNDVDKQPCLATLNTLNGCYLLNSGNSGACCNKIMILNR